MKNYIDDIFFNELFNIQEREIYARITALTFFEKPIEFIEGKVTGGSINIDGASNVRRTCSLTLVAQDININHFYWGLKNKFKLEIGLKNKINKEYPDIIWFKQGIFVITTFNTSQSVNNYNINISGKDKMCLLNGDLAGALPHTTDFGVEEIVDGTTTNYISVPIKRILTQSIQTFGNELPHNIVINDIDDYGVDLLEYRGDIPIYLLKDINTNEIRNMTLNPNQLCWVNDTETTIGNIEHFDSLVKLDNTSNNYTIIKLDPMANIYYSVIKLEYGMNAGYRTTDLIYAGDLIANVGETLTSIYDKIVNMLGEFEYFYDIDGRFIFQRKRTYVNTPFNSLKNNNDQIYADAAINSSISTFNLLNSKLIISFQNTPNLLNLKNDYTVWGKKKTASGAELDIHMRYAIDKKPTTYFSLLESREFNSSEYDWRELIYQMALDYRRFYFTDPDFLFNLMEKNPWCLNGKTGYEQYYIDLEGFWRYLYNPNPIAEEANNYFSITDNNKYWNKDVINNPENLIFWFDFLEADTSDLSKYSVLAVGDRTKVINDNNVKKIYYREIPKVIFVNSINSSLQKETGYIYLQLPTEMENLFTISTKGLSCKERIDELLYQHSYCIENANITTLPIYHLEPNTRILIRDDNSKINGEYLINKLTIPLTYNGTMNISAVKSITNIN